MKEGWVPSSSSAAPPPSEEDVYDEGSCRAEQVEAVWGDWLQAHVMWPMITLLAMTVVFILVHRIYENRYTRHKNFRRFVRLYLGTAGSTEVPRPTFLVTLHFAAMVSSAVSVLNWCAHTYARQTYEATRGWMMFMAYIDLCNWAVNRLKGECTPGCLWQVNGIVDMLTIVPRLRCSQAQLCPGGADWLTLHFLRSYQVLYSFEEIQETGFFRDFARQVQLLLRVAMQVFCLVLIMAGCFFTSEVLGDPPFMKDTCIKTQHGDSISLVQTIYFTLATVTTVGYGDFAPRTILSRLVGACFIVIGVSAIYKIQFEFGEMWSSCKEGTGCFRGAASREAAMEPHVVIVLAVKERPSQLSSLLGGFLKELLHNSHGNTVDQDEGPAGWCPWRKAKRRHRHVADQRSGWPTVVVFSPSLWDVEGNMTFDEFVESLDLPSKAVSKVHYIVGSRTSKADLDRAAIASSSLTFVVSSLTSENPDEDDGQSLFTAIMLLNLYPEVRLRLMVERPESVNLAVQAGVHPTRCFSSRELKANILAQSARCHGLLPVLFGLFNSGDEDDQDHCVQGQVALAPRKAKRQNSRKSYLKRAMSNFEAFREHTHWMLPYIEALHNSAHAFELDAVWHGRCLEDLILEVFQRSGAIVVGVYDKGNLVILPQAANKRILRTGQIIFAVANSADCLKPFRLHGTAAGDWRGSFYRAKDFQGRKAREEGFHRDAAQHMKAQLQTRLVPAKQDQQPVYKQSGRRESRRESMRTDSVSGLNAVNARLMSMDHRFSLQSASIDMHSMLQLPPAGNKGHRLSSVSEMQKGGRPSSPRLSKVSETQMNRQNSPRTMTRSLSEHNLASSARGSLMIPSSLEVPFSPFFPGGNRSRSASTLEAAPIDPRQIVRAWRTEVEQDGGELVVLIVGNGEVWQQVRTFVQGVRAPYLPVHPVVVILAPEAPKENFFEDCGEHVAVLEGDCLSAKALLDAGVAEANAVVVMSGQALAQDVLHAANYRDYRTIVCSQMLECWCGFSKREVFTIYEVVDSRSVNRLPKLRNTPVTNMEKLFGGSDDGFAAMHSVYGPAPTIGTLGALTPIFSCRTTNSDDAEGDCKVPAVRGSLLGVPRMPRGSQFSMQSVLRAPSSASVYSNYSSNLRYVREHEATGAANEAVKEPPAVFNARFAAGQVFTSELWGAMLGRVFYMPALVELVQTLVMPDRKNQTSFCWQVRVPEDYHRKAFSNLFNDMLLDRWHIKEQKRSASMDSPARAAEVFHESEKPMGSEGKHVRLAEPEQDEEEQLSVGPAICLALYCVRDDVGTRVAENRDGSHPSDERSPDRPPPRVTIPEDLDPKADDPEEKVFAQGTGGHHYTLLCPSANRVVQPMDWVIVIGSERFGELAYDLGLLRGSGRVCKPAPDEADLDYDDESDDAGEGSMPVTPKNAAGPCLVEDGHQSNMVNVPGAGEQAPDGMQLSERGRGEAGLSGTLQVTIPEAEGVAGDIGSDGASSRQSSEKPQRRSKSIG
eukprot:TRINITY_DN63969_c0_g1_i1.p1 TRINITY_DN63969_c0_g1~~TRINITY_DN63969_c0_g1_i1.p1  ORF type:complete len:1499 (-),score=248.50 TRINITY_DN63969_c0_g1_i1:97-4593(-)